MATDMRSMVGALSQLPAGQRKTMMRERLEMFASMNDLERSSAMRQMMEAVGTLAREDAKKLLDSGGALALLWLSVAAGVWLVIAPFVLGYAGTGAQPVDTVVGIAIVVLTGIVAIWRPAE